MASNIEGQLHGYLQEHNVEALLKDIVVQVWSKKRKRGRECLRTRDTHEM